VWCCDGACDWVDSAIWRFPAPTSGLRFFIFIYIIFYSDSPHRELSNAVFLFDLSLLFDFILIFKVDVFSRFNLVNFSDFWLYCDLIDYCFLFSCWAFALQYVAACLCSVAYLYLTSAGSVHHSHSQFYAAFQMIMKPAGAWLSSHRQPICIRTDPNRYEPIRTDILTFLSRTEPNRYFFFLGPNWPDLNFRLAEKIRTEPI
jgi:hypothetical protein